MNRGYMMVLRYFADSTGQSILDVLKSIELRGVDIKKERVAVIKFGVNY